MNKQRSRFTKLIAIIITSLIIGLGLWIIIALTISGQHDKQSIEAAVNDIALPPQYSLVSSTYDNQRCLDVCAHTVLRYKSKDGINLDEQMVTDMLVQLGYKYNGHTYSRIYKNKNVHVSQTKLSATELMIDVSL